MDTDTNLPLNNNEFPYSIDFVDKETNDELLRDFSGERTGFVQVGAKKWFFPSKYKEHAVHFYNFEVRPDDIWVVSYPRSGTTWTQELVWMVANDLDYETAEKTPLTERFPFLEFSMFIHDDVKREFVEENAHDPDGVEMIEAMAFPGWKALAALPSPRFIKTHFPFSLLPPTLLSSGAKVIYVARNPKDVAVSFYHLNRSIRTQGYQGDFTKYWKYFSSNLHAWAPYWTHLEEAWNLKQHPNVLFLFYEELSKDLILGIKKVAGFLGKDYNPTQTALLANHLSIDNFKNNKSVNLSAMKSLGIMKSGEQSFIRNGKSGGWPEQFTSSLNAEADMWIAENLKNTDMRFPQEDSNNNLSIK